MIIYTMMLTCRSLVASFRYLSKSILMRNSKASGSFLLASSNCSLRCWHSLAPMTPKCLRISSSRNSSSFSSRTRETGRMVYLCSHMILSTTGMTMSLMTPPLKISPSLSSFYFGFHSIFVFNRSSSTTRPHLAHMSSPLLWSMIGEC